MGTAHHQTNYSGGQCPPYLTLIRRRLSSERSPHVIYAVVSMLLGIQELDWGAAFVEDS